MRPVILAIFAALAIAKAANGQAVAPGVSGPSKLAPVTRLDLSDDRAFLSRPYDKPSAAEDPIDSRTAVDHRFGPHGPVGQAGYLCGISGIGPDNDGPRGGPASAFEHFGTFLGTSVGYAFR
jgi:hypothetical protein